MKNYFHIVGFILCTLLVFGSEVNAFNFEFDAFGDEKSNDKTNNILSPDFSSHTTQSNGADSGIPQEIDSVRAVSGDSSDTARRGEAIRQQILAAAVRNSHEGSKMKDYFETQIDREVNVQLGDLFVSNYYVPGDAGGEYPYWGVNPCGGYSTSFTAASSERCPGTQGGGNLIVDGIGGFVDINDGFESQNSNKSNDTVDHTGGGLISF